MKLNAREKAKRAKAEKVAARERMRSAGLTTGHDSKYARKIQRKLSGRGAVSPHWQWWLKLC